MDDVIFKAIQQHLIWIPEKGIGYYPVRERYKYNDEYFDKYAKYELTPLGNRLNNFRVELVNKYTRDRILDIGIGCGSFMKLRGNCVGYDINPKSIAWLKERGLYFDLAWKAFDLISGITFFDSLEHIPTPGELLDRTTNQFVFISIPIFKDLNHLLDSRHFRKDEHYYYFTREGFINYMADYNFDLLEVTNGEIKCGREDIYTFVFKKSGKG